MGLMSGKTARGPRLVFVMKDGIRGHENQSAGIAWWLQELGGSEIVEIDVPMLSGFERFLRLKVLAKSLGSGDGRVCRRWLEGAGGDGILEFVLERIATAGVKAKNVLFLSAGSSAAPWCLALARITDAGCCTIMTPSVLGTSPFDQAVVPEHDFPEPASNLLATLGAPNMIRPELLESEAAKLENDYPSSSSLRWALLIGGSDKNYRLSPEWVRRWLPPLLENAEKNGADLYITTSRRTDPEAERAIVEMTEGHGSVRALILASKIRWNPVPGMLGLCVRTYCSEDSVSMISEAVTAGCDVRILPLERNGGFRSALQRATEKLVNKGLFPGRWIWGVPRFDRMTNRMKEAGLLEMVAGERSIDNLIRSVPPAGFNEARRAAGWILKRSDA